MIEPDLGGEPEVLKLAGVDWSYDRDSILHSLDFSLVAGEHCVVLGQSGSGKSTLLRLIAGLISPQSGSITINQQPAQRVSPKDRDVSLMFQDDRLYPHLSLRRAMNLACRASLVNGNVATEVECLAARFQITDILDRRPDQVSGGQLRRAALAKAILRRPTILLLDEPLHGLDASLREDFLSLLNELPRRRGRTADGKPLPPTAIVHVTHDGDEAMRLADRIAVLDQGRIVQSATPWEIYRRPQTLAVARALGQPSVNVILPIARNAFALDANAAHWIVRPEDIKVMFGPNDGSDEARWPAELVQSSFVNGSWISLWRSHQQEWRCVSGEDPREKVAGHTGTLSIPRDRILRIDPALSQSS